MQLTPRRLAGALAAVAVGLALSASTSGAATSCWQRVITDWSHDGSIGGSYSTACLRAAQRHVPTDLKIYSTIDDDLQRAVRVHAARRLAVARRPTLAAAGVPATAPASLSPFA